MGDSIPTHVGLGYIGKLAEQARESKLGRKASLLYGLCCSLSLQVSSSTSLHDRLTKGGTNPFSPGCFWSWCFNTAVVTLIKTYSQLQCPFFREVRPSPRCSSLFSPLLHSPLSTQCFGWIASSTVTHGSTNPELIGK